MKRTLFLLFLAAVVVCSCAGGGERSSTKITARLGTAPLIDGIFEEGEWDDANVVVPDTAKAIYLKHDRNNLYVAVNGDGGNIYVVKGDKLYVLHASFSLGRAEYSRADGDTWTRDKEYVWELYRLQEKTAEEINAGITGYLKQNGWAGSLIPMGSKTQTEFAISFEWLNKPAGTPKFLISSIQNIPRSEIKGGDPRIRWPATAAPIDSLDRGYTPEKITLDVSGWSSIAIDTAH